MKINSIQNTYSRSTNFGAIPVAEIKAKGQDSVYKLYKLEESDRDFLEKMSEKIDVKNLKSGLDEYDYLVWDKLIKGAIRTSFDEGKTAYLETVDNAPCGIMNYQKIRNTQTNQPYAYHLDYITTLPKAKDEKTPYAGQILFHELFKQFIDEKQTYISLEAPNNSPFSPIAKYLNLGFNITGGTDYAETLRIYENNVKKTYKKQQEFLTFDRFEKSESVDLDEHTDLSVFEQ